MNTFAPDRRRLAGGAVNTWMRRSRCGGQYGARAGFSEMRRTQTNGERVRKFALKPESDMPALKTGARVRHLDEA
jgi:hypothetical protein